MFLLQFNAFTTMVANNFTMPSDDQEFLVLQKRIFMERGLDLSQYREKCLKRRINMRLRATGANTYPEYLAVLRREPSEYERLFDVLTINVTNFFRDKSAYRVIEETVIPELVSSKKRQGKKLIRIWSAGCASGEEPYSMAILFHQVLGKRIGDYLISIYATDIDEKVLEKAKKAEYEADTVSKVDEKILNRYFNHDLKYSLKEEIKQMVKFRRADLISAKPLTHLDIIVCRNVFIYFTKDLQAKLIEKYYAGLNQDGYLIIGMTESLPGESARLFRPVSIRERIYKKK